MIEYGYFCDYLSHRVVQQALCELAYVGYKSWRLSSKTFKTQQVSLLLALWNENIKFQVTANWDGYCF